MSPISQALLEQVLALPDEDRASVADLLLESLNGAAEPGAETAWDAVVERRVQEIDSGTVQTIPWSEVKRRLFRESR